jgi:hypothetical protein
MKIFIPRHISWGWFNMSVTLGPASISLVQLLILALGIGLSLWVWNNLTTNNMDKGIAFFLVLPILIIFVFIAFFKYSELTLVPFIAKMIRTYFLNTTLKFQIPRDKVDPIAITYAKIKKVDHEQVYIKKQFMIDNESLDKLKVFTEQQSQQRK